MQILRNGHFDMFFRLVDNYIKDSYKGLVSTLLKEEKLSVGELRELISQVETYEKTKK